MPQYEDTAHLKRAGLDFDWVKWTLLLIAQIGTRKFTGGTAVLIGDRLALTADHIRDTFARKAKEGRTRLSWMPPDETANAAHDLGFAIEAMQFLDGGARMLRWHVKAWHRLAGDSDLAALTLQAHAECPAAKDYVLPFDQHPWLQLFPAATGRQIHVVGWPDDPKSPGGEIINRQLRDFYPYSSTGAVRQIGEGPGEHDEWKYPVQMFTSAETHIGMSGGPVLTVKPGLGYGICAIHSKGEPDSRGFDHHSTEHLLWRLLSTRVEVPPSALSKNGEASILELAKQDFLNAPGWTYYRVFDDGPGYRRTACLVPELAVFGTFRGAPNWIEGVNVPIDPAAPLP
ncbi:MAG: trypsin-like peptidase domain-containing protein, partial [Terriglobales bacterium]